MTLVLRTDDRPAHLPGASGTEPDGRPVARTRPNVSGDLPTIFETAPMFRRVLAGYDRFQVDTYVQWAEDQLATAEREREHLESRHLRTRAELDEARELLSHSSGGGQFLSLSRRVGSMLAAAADEAEGMRVEAAAHRKAAAAEAGRTVELARRLLADAEAEAARLVAEAATLVEEMTARADRIVAEAEETAAAVHARAQARLAEAREAERRAVRRAEEIRQQSQDEVDDARLRARHEIARMLGTGRDERRRADAEADESRKELDRAAEATRERLDRAAEATRDRLDRAAAAHRAALREEVAALEQRRSALRAEVESLAERGTGAAPRPPAGPLRRLVERSRSVRGR